VPTSKNANEYPAGKTGSERDVSFANRSEPFANRMQTSGEREAIPP
jgi:hypothetical protein